MAAQDPLIPPQQPGWLPPAKLPDAEASFGSSQYSSAPPMYELRPLTTSEVLDRTFAIYRTNFWLFAGIASFSGILQSLAAATQMILQSRIMVQFSHAQPGRLPHSPFGSAVPVLFGSLASILFFLSYSVTTAACVFALGEIYLGRYTTIAESFRATIRRWYAYLGIACWQAGSLMWLPLAIIVPGFTLIAVAAARGAGFAVAGGILVFVGMFAGFVVGYIFYLRNSFGVPIAVLERMKVRPSMRRSKVLTKGAKWRLLLIWLITLALFMVVGVLQAPLAFISLLMIAKGGHAYLTQAITVVIGFLGHTVVTPVVMIGTGLVYFDQRVRLEAFDIEFLLHEEQALEAGAPVSAADSPQASAQGIDGLTS